MRNIGRALSGNVSALAGTTHILKDFPSLLESLNFT